MDQPGVLIVGGVDSSHRAGLDADRDAANAFECDVHAVASAMTTQDLFQVRSVEERLLWKTEAEDVLKAHSSGPGQVRALKFGLLPGVASIVEAARLVARTRHGREQIPAVVDPVIRATTGYRFWSDREMVAVRDSLLIAGPILTPNLDELAELAWTDRNQLDSSDEARVRAARALLDGGVSAVVAKGGHGPEGESVRDLVVAPGEDPIWITRDRVPGKGIGGSGCRFAAALACSLAHGKTLVDAARMAGDFVAERIRTATVS